MKIKFLIISIIMAVIIIVANLLLLMPPGKTDTPQKPVPRKVEHRLKTMAFFENGWGGVYVDSFPGFQEKYRFIDIVSPFWYSVDDTGHIRVDRSRSEVRDFTGGKGVSMIPLITNWQGKSGRFLTDDKARRISLDNLRELARGYEGLNLDIEYLPVNYRDALTRYVQELYALLVKDSKHLYVCVFPQVDFPESRAGLHDYQALSAACDGLIMMAYDYRRPGTPAGPVAPIFWVEANIQHALKTVPPGKLWLGIPGYGYRWRGQAKAVAVPAWKAEQDALEQNLAQWDSDSQTPFFNSIHNGENEVIWYEDQRSASEKLKLARKYKLKGVALWRLGYEVGDFWELIGEDRESK